MKTCASCKRDFEPSSRHKDCPKCRAKQQKTPCEKCGTLNGRKYKKCINCHNGSGENSPRWRGGVVYHKKGYKMIASPGHPARMDSRHSYVFEHILVMEGMLGRYLLPYEKVHHLNGVRDDNRPENLELWCKPQPVGIRAFDAVKWAQDVLELYAPELLNGCNPVSSEGGTRTRESVPSTSTSNLLH